MEIEQISGDTMSPKSFVVLGVSHSVQGDVDFIDAFDDPDYRDIVSQIISNDRIDFVGEECAVNTTDAERIALKLLGAGHYLNVDSEDKKKEGVGNTYVPPAVGELPVHGWVVSENEKREQIWVDLLVERTAERGLLICGFYHAFSVAAKLFKREFDVDARTYMPWEKLRTNPMRKWGQE